MNLALHLEHTLLRPDATPADVERLCQEAIALRVFGVCVAPLFVVQARALLQGSGVRLVSVVGFPFGANTPEIKADEARQLLRDGADEIDMVIPVGLARAGDDACVLDHVRRVRQAVPRAVLKVILETGHFDPERLAALAQVVLEAEPEFLKTCTGFGPRGASVADVKTLSACARGKAQVKASGGIRSRQDAELFLLAGATRIGTSSSVKILETGIS